MRGPSARCQGLSKPQVHPLSNRRASETLCPNLHYLACGISDRKYRMAMWDTSGVKGIVAFSICHGYEHLASGRQRYFLIWLRSIALQAWDGCQLVQLKRESTEQFIIP